MPCLKHKEEHRVCKEKTQKYIIIFDKNFRDGFKIKVAQSASKII